MKREIFGNLENGTPIEIITLLNDKAELKIMTRGATIVSFKTFGTDIVGGYDGFDGYIADAGSYQGATVGRVANRVADAQFSMDGAIYMIGGDIVSELGDGIYRFENIPVRDYPLIITFGDFI